MLSNKKRLKDPKIGSIFLKLESKTCQKRTSAKPNNSSALDKCPLYRGLLILASIGILIVNIP